MTRAKFAIAGIVVLMTTTGSSSIEAQGLKGARMPEKILGRLLYVTGTNDQERWKTFLDAQPKLVGMSFDAVCKQFGAGPITAPDRSYVEYGLTDEPVKSGTKGNTWLHLKIFFRDGIAHKYVVEAIQ
ncbi:MAG TPA: hypothetical protein V6C76_01535 [Drouetiella sp.]